MLILVAGSTRRTRLLVFLGICFAIAQGVRASGFSVHELGSRAPGMAMAFISIADDGSALYYNPAGIAFQKGTRFEMDGFAVYGLFRFIPADVPRGTIVPEKGFNGSVHPKIQGVANLYFTKELSDKWTLGFGSFMPFGLGGNWTNFKDSDPANAKYVGRFAGTRPLMQSIWFQPTASYRLGENSSIALGVALVHTHVLFERSFINPFDDGLAFAKVLAPNVFPGQDPDLAARSIARLLPEGRSSIRGTSNSPGFSLGYLYKHPRSKTSIGLLFRSPVVLHIKGKASFAFTDNYALKSFIGAKTIPNLFPDQDVKFSFVTPGSYGVGVSNSSFWNSTIAVDFLVQDFARFKDVAVNFSKTDGTATPKENRLSYDFGKSYQLRTGIEKRLNKSTIVRGGYFFDHAPEPDKSVGPFFPDSTRNTFTLGASRQRGNAEFTIFYEAIKFLHRKTDVPANAYIFTNGLYKGFGHIVGFGFRMNIGGTTIDVPR